MTNSFSTLSLHAGQQADPTTGSRAVPIYQTTSYQFDSVEHAAALFGLEQAGNIYSRIMNPTNEVLEKRLAALEGGSAALALASGQAAITLAALNLASAGQNLVSSSHLYGGTYNLFAYTLPRFGITVRFADPTDPAAFEAAIDEKTRAVFVEGIGNPKNRLARLSEISDIAHRNGIPLIVDNTVTSPYLLRPFEHGADIIVHSLTKFIGGHGTAIGGAIVEKGTFNWADGKFPEFTEPDPTYNGICYWDTFGANGAAAMGRKVTLFFTFWGLNILRKVEGNKVKKPFMDGMFGKMMPKGSKKLGLSRMNMAGMGPKMIRMVMKNKNVDSLETLLQQALDMGVRLVACQMSMDIMGIAAEELLDGVELAGVASYLDAAESSDVNLFI